MCFLAEVIAKRSQNTVWRCSVDGSSVSHDRIRRVSMDKFYGIVTGIDNAFYMICKQLPNTIEKLIANSLIYSGGKINDQLFEARLMELFLRTVKSIFSKIVGIPNLR